MGLPAAGAAADPDGTALAEKPGLFGRWFGGDKAEAKKPAAKDAKPAIPPADVKLAHKPEDTSTLQSVRDGAAGRQSAAERVREEAAFFRRQAVCDELRAVALQTNDETLYRQADELEKRAYALYVKRVGNRAASAGAFESDEQTLAKHLGPNAARSGRPDAERAAGKDKTSRATATEGKP
jgi:hypothetical protein